MARSKGLDRFRQLRINTESLQLETRYPLGGVTGSLVNESLSPIERFDFGCCPICFSTENLTDEHVPPEQAGGGVVTKTCSRCNSRLGFLVDVDLIDFMASSTRSSWSSPGSAVRGHRNVDRTLMRSTLDGQFALILSGNDAVRREFREMMATGEIEGTFPELDLRRPRISGLKNAYLAACVQLREIPQTESAQRIRDELLSVRDLPSRRVELPGCPIAFDVLMARPANDMPAPGLHLCRLVGPSGEVTAILFSGRLLVEWPFQDVPPRDRCESRKDE